MYKPFTNKTIVITGGTGSLGKVLVRRILSGELGKPEKIIIFSRDEAKQHDMRMAYETHQSATDEIIYQDFKKIVQFRIGDIRNYNSVCSVLRGADIVVNTAALKQVPSCEYFPYEAVETNITGAHNIVMAIQQYNLPIETVVGVSTDKAVKPTTTMGMTKSIQERIFLTANISLPDTRFIAVRYGNVLASRGSVVPLFLEQIKAGGPITITTEDMTRFLLPLDSGVDTIFAALLNASAGEIFVPIIPAAKIIDVAQVLINNSHKQIDIQIIGIRPGEKIHEILVSEEESPRTYQLGDYYVVQPMLPELINKKIISVLPGEYSSKKFVMTYDEVFNLFKKHNFLQENTK